MQNSWNSWCIQTLSTGLHKKRIMKYTVAMSLDYVFLSQKKRKKALYFKICENSVFPFYHLISESKKCVCVEAGATLPSYYG